jgi:hypothetical protein
MLPSIETYRHHLEPLSLTPTEEDDLLLNLRQILSTFLDIALGVDPTQVACGIGPRILEDNSHSVVEYSGSIQRQFGVSSRSVAESRSKDE